ncbi:MAG: hypothetical protein HQ523_00235 [Lentisphaerae bacterium]|nr:hypothetical protein [Lentisphaerota bacterium]
MRDQHIKAIELADAGQWDDAHRIVQALGDTTASWIHANLHREEGDLGNADYWYQRAGKTRVDLSFAAERATIRATL